MESNDNDLSPSSSTSATTMAVPNPSSSPQKPTEQSAVQDNPVPNSDLPVSSTPVNPNPNPTPTPVLPSPSQIQPFAPRPQVSTVPPPSFRLATPPVPHPTAPQPNAASFPVQVHPPGVSPLPVMMPPASGVVRSVPKMVSPQYVQVNNPGLRM